tara:strand:- start:968 stop:1123 length:156 start_codon:yes stop_codon:yes gene_type:complete
MSINLCNFAVQNLQKIFILKANSKPCVALVKLSIVEIYPLAFTQIMKKQVI